MKTRPYYLAGSWRDDGEPFEVRSPHDGSLVAEVARPTEPDIESALAQAAAVLDEAQRVPIHARAEALTHISRRILERLEDLAQLIALEGGKPIKWARIEISRAASTFRWAAEECRRTGGEFQRLDTDPSMEQRAVLVRRFPLGTVLGIAPFNWPVNLVAHKMAPALAVGAPIIVKPATATPLGALALAEFFDETNLPKAMLSVLTARADAAEKMVTDPRVAMVSFTGSSDVGWHLQRQAAEKRFTLELGGNAAVIVHEDADVDHAAARIAVGGYYQAGQACVAVQRVLVHRPVYEEFVNRLVKEVAQLKVGDPLDETVDVGPLIDREAANRVGSWIDEAVAGGAQLVLGGAVKDAFVTPTILTDTTPDMKVVRDEVFGPVTAVTAYDTFSEALDLVNDSEYGLHTGVFTSDVTRAFEAHRTLKVGGIILNDTSAFRADQMPYGGTKRSGHGREGLRYAMEDMTEPRALVFSGIPL
ncbi:MAG: aldehyde dehydrogenase family protein [Acidimicrobiia bacterium]